MTQFKFESTFSSRLKDYYSTRKDPSWLQTSTFASSLPMLVTKSLIPSVEWFPNSSLKCPNIGHKNFYFYLTLIYLFLFSIVSRNVIYSYNKTLEIKIKHTHKWSNVTFYVKIIPDVRFFKKTDLICRSTPLCVHNSPWLTWVTDNSGLSFSVC